MRLMSVLDSIFYYNVVHNQERVRRVVCCIKRLFSRMLILGAVGNGDPVGEILKRELCAKVTRVGAYGTGI